MKKITLLILCVAMITLCACDNAQPQTSVSVGPSIEVTDSPAPSVEISVAPTSTLDASNSIPPPDTTSFTQSELQYYYDNFADGKAVDENVKAIKPETMDALYVEFKDYYTEAISIMQVIERVGAPCSYCLREGTWEWEVWEYKREGGGQYWILTRKGSPRIMRMFSSEISQTFDKFGEPIDFWIY